MIDGGYFPKLIANRPKELDAACVREIASVSHCISSGPENWIDHWRHNELGWFNTVADAMSVVPKAERARYRLFAYRLEPFAYRQGDRIDIVIPTDVRPDAIGPEFVERGFDAVSKSMERILGLECSPLSCNYLAAEVPANEFCLFPSRDAAAAAAQSFSIEQPEPGDYYVIQVLELTDPSSRLTMTGDGERARQDSNLSHPLAGPHPHSRASLGGSRRAAVRRTRRGSPGP
jgi:hypothetical protein